MSDHKVAGVPVTGITLDSKTINAFLRTFVNRPGMPQLEFADGSFVLSTPFGNKMNLTANDICIDGNGLRINFDVI